MSRRSANRELAAWCRANNVAPVGAAWEAVKAGERDLAVLARLNVSEPLRNPGDFASHSLPKRTEDGHRLPGGLRVGDVLPNGWEVTTLPMCDRETGAVLVGVLTRGGEHREASLDPRVPVDVWSPPKRVAPAWMSAASEAYRAALAAWESALEPRMHQAKVIAPAVTNGLDGAAELQQCERRDAEAAYPRPSWRAFCREYAAAYKAPEGVAS